jgi:hypothetical protein
MRTTIKENIGFGLFIAIIFLLGVFAGQKFEGWLNKDQYEINKLMKKKLDLEIQILSNDPRT